MRNRKEAHEMNNNLLRHQTVILIGKILHPLTESNLIPFPEYREIIAQLKHIAAKGEALPVAFVSGLRIRLGQLSQFMILPIPIG